MNAAGFNADIKAGLIVNQRNEDTKVTSGRELHFDYALGRAWPTAEWPG